MSCVVAFIDLTGAPVDRASLLRLAAVAPYDGRQASVWSSGTVGLCGVPLGQRAAILSIDAHPGCGSPIVVALDGRLDERADLVSRLRREVAVDPDRVSDADLVRLAYLAWGADFVARLSGDFALCLWDGRARRLLAARDHLGLKPLYMARTASALVVGTVVASVRRGPGVSDRLSDRAVGDFLLFGDPQHPSDTVFADVQRIPPAHTLTWTPTSAMTVAPFWRLDAPAPMRHRDARDAALQLRATLQRAVDDRVAGGPVAVLMSGGLDSTSVAALARAAAGDSTRVRAVTAVYENAFHDEERQFSAIAANALAIPIDHLAVDDYQLFARWGSGGLPPVPVTEPLTAIMEDLLGRVASHSDVTLAGDGGDPLLMASTVPRHLGRVPIADVVGGVTALAWRYHRLPLLGVRSAFRRMRRRDTPIPSWLAAPLLASYDARARVREVSTLEAPEGLRPESMRRLRAGWWPSMFESLHPGATRQPVEVRFPFFDRRVIALALALPSYPWCVNKIVLREAMTGLLPEAVRLRPKTPLPVDSVAIRPRWRLDEAVRILDEAPGLSRYVDARRLAASVRPDRLLLDAEPGTLAAMSLALWLTHAPPVHEARVREATATPA